jgi:S-(hydroxymethyl)glutathione dehydrogenase/alcohol dehydrogenase
VTAARGLLFDGPGAPLRVVDLRLDPPAAGEVRVRMVASGVCHSDLHVVDGDWARPAGVVLGHEGAGIVEAVGPESPAIGRAAGGRRPRVGDLVVLAWTAPCMRCAACSRGEPWLCLKPVGRGYRLDPTLVRVHALDGAPVGVYAGIGTFSTHQVVSELAAIPVDPATPPEVAALIGCSAATGVGAVRNTAGVRPGDSVVVLGLGGVGMAALVAAAADGAAPVIAVDLEPAQRDAARALGADLALAPDELLAATRALPGGGADHVLECIGLVPTVELAVEAVRPGGQVTLVGMPAQGERAGIDVYRFVELGKRLVGSDYGSSLPARDFPTIASDVVAGRLPLGRLIRESIGLEDVPSALDAMRRRESGRRVVRFEGT